jgi:putative sugar O-methyltransferase
VNYSLGRKYLAVVNENEKQIWKSLPDFKQNDRLGKPRTFSFENIGRISPTTLRYVAVATDIRREFGFSKIDKIVEIGGGYGGQVSILNFLGVFEEYFIFDLPEVQKLIQRYVSSTGVKRIKFPDLSDSNLQEYDLVISNYAFSELPRKIQDEYLEKVILRSRRGFMLMNSGKENQTGRSTGKISVEELHKLIPNLRELPEVPLTSPDNYLLVWQK